VFYINKFFLALGSNDALIMQNGCDIILTVNQLVACGMPTFEML